MSVGSGGCWLGPATMRLAEAVAPLPLSVEVTALVVLFCVPEVVPVTFTANVHEALAASDAPDSVTLDDPAAAAIVPPPQLPVNPFGELTICPVGRLSVKPIPLSDWPALGFVRLKVRDVLPFNGTLAAPNALAMVGAMITGGGTFTLDDPPPHPSAQSRLAARNAIDAECNATVRVMRISCDQTRSWSCS